MTDLNRLFEPTDDGEREAFAVEDLVFQVQMEIHRAMKRHSIDQAELARRLNVSPARVSQYFSKDGPNLTVKTIARIFHAIGESVALQRCRADSSEVTAVRPVTDERVRLIAGGIVTNKTWQFHSSANDNNGSLSVAAA